MLLHQAQRLLIPQKTMCRDVPILSFLLAMLSSLRDEINSKAPQCFLYNLC